MKNYLQTFKNYATFSGRAKRKEYWMFFLINMIISVALQIIQYVCDMEYLVLPLLFSLVILLPSLSVAVRRLHDIERSGFWIFIGFVPIIGSIILLVFLCQKGTLGINRYGSAPM